VYEASYGEVVASTKIRHLQRVESYLVAQRRFGHLFDSDGEVVAPDVIAKIQAIADRNIERFGLLEEVV
jgi:pyruvate ferredoxin oxidoreductase beta subunit